MLVISREINQSVMVGDDLRITLSWVRGDRVSLRLDEHPTDGTAATAGSVVTLRLDEAHRCRTNVTVTIVHVRGDRVRLGFKAPASVAVHRLEVYQVMHPGSAWPDDADRR
jgi:carbon storage regulator